MKMIKKTIWLAISLFFGLLVSQVVGECIRAYDTAKPQTHKVVSQVPPANCIYSAVDYGPSPFAWVCK